jgi:hypothetical protein
VNSSSPEFNIAATDETVLARVSEITGGEVIASSDAGRTDLFTRRSVKSIPHEVWEWLIVAALILLPVDVGVRRVLIIREEITLASKWIRAKVRRASPEKVDSGASASMAKLKGARARVMLGDPGAEGKEPSSVFVPPQQRDQGSKTLASQEVAENAQPLASRLLDAKRKRRQ